MEVAEARVRILGDGDEEVCDDKITNIEPEITDSVDIASEITDSVDLLENIITGGDDSLESGINYSVNLETNIIDSVDLESENTDSPNLETGMSQPELDVGENSETGSITADILAQTPIDFSNKYPAGPFYLQHKPITPQSIRILLEIGPCQPGKDEHYIFPANKLKRRFHKECYSKSLENG